MTRSRLVVFMALIVVGIGAAAAIGAFYLDPARAAVGPLSAEATVLPADSRFVMGFDVRRFVESPFYQRFGADHGKARPDAFVQIEEQVGLDPEKDVDRVVVAGREATGKGKQGGVALVSGRFDRYKLGRAIEQRPGVTTKHHQGTAMYVYREGQRDGAAVAFLDDSTLVLGAQPDVEAVIDNRLRGQAGLRANATLMALLETVKPGSTFWMAGDQSVLSRLPAGIPGPGGSPMQLPAVRSVVITGDLDPLVAIEVTGETADAASAQSLADVLRGLLAMASLQAQQKPELRQLASAVNVTTDANRVQVNGRFPYELLDALQSKRPAVSGGAPSR